MVHWAKRERWLLEPVEFRLLTGSLENLGGGLEHSVFFHQKQGRVLKITRPPYFGIPLDLDKYALNALWANLLFADSITFEGFLEVDDAVSVVVSQPYVVGTSPSENQIRKWFEEQNYVKTGFNKWHGPDGEVITDAHVGNFIRRSDGFLVPIDLQILNPGHQILSLME